MMLLKYLSWQVLLILPALIQDNEFIKTDHQKSVKQSNSIVSVVYFYFLQSIRPDDLISQRINEAANFFAGMIMILSILIAIGLVLLIIIEKMGCRKGRKREELEGKNCTENTDFQRNGSNNRGYNKQMSQHQILQNRAVNSINNIKFKLKQDYFMSVYNDLLILQHIIPNLCKETLRDLLPEIRKMQRLAESDQRELISMEKILNILSDTPDDHPLLNDFLQSTVPDNLISVKGY